jgi:hypothetical protein
MKSESAVCSRVRPIPILDVARIAESLIFVSASTASLSRRVWHFCLRLDIIDSQISRLTRIFKRWGASCLKQMSRRLNTVAGLMFMMCKRMKGSWPIKESIPGPDPWDDSAWKDCEDFGRSTLNLKGVNNLVFFLETNSKPPVLAVNLSSNTSSYTHMQFLR